LLEKLEESLLFSIVVVDASSSIEGMVHIMMHHIREIDAVAGPEAYYIP
jgi:chemotaxis receptor (MCP) glutamine deamidase CheD